MKTILSLTTIVSIGYSSGLESCSSSNTWIESLPSLPKKTGECASTIINNILYVAGEANTETYSIDLTSSNPSWTTVSNRIYQGNHDASLTINNKWWLIGGIDNNAYGKLQIYDPSTNKWTEDKNSLPWDGGSVCATYISKYNTIYVCGGIQGFNNGKSSGGTNTTNKCAYYNLDNTNNGWKSFKSMPYRRNHAATTVAMDKMWIFGGREGKNTPSDGFNTVQIYDPNDDTWVYYGQQELKNNIGNEYKIETGQFFDKYSDTDIEPMPVGRGGTGTAIYISEYNIFFVFGGETRDDTTYATSNKVYNRVDIYNYTDNKWYSGTKMPVPRHGIFPVYYQNDGDKGSIHIASGGEHNGWNISSVYDKYCV